MSRRWVGVRRAGALAVLGLLAACGSAADSGGAGSARASSGGVTDTSTAPATATVTPPAVTPATIGSPSAGTASGGGCTSTHPATDTAPLPFDTATHSFGAALAPLNPPADVHVYSAEPALSIDLGKVYRMTITTPRGAIVMLLEPQLAPCTVNNIVTLARNHFYDGLTFHRVVPGFVVQAGDPKGDGSGGPGFTFADEPVRQQYVVGAVAMANAGANTNGSQFFIDIADDRQLPAKYNLFGHVLSGQDVANAVQQGDVMTTVTVQQSQ